MEEDRWNKLVAYIKGDDIELMVEACENLQNESEATDVPRLLELLGHESFVVREAASWPLAIVGGPAVLPELFTAFQRGFDEGLDNDGFSAALICLVELNRKGSRQTLLTLRNSPNLKVRENAEWLLEFC